MNFGIKKTKIDAQALYKAFKDCVTNGCQMVIYFSEEVPEVN
jgi:hypothetical protein